MTTTTLAESIRAAIPQLAKVAGESARLEAELLLCSLLDKPRSHLFAWPEQILTREQQKCFQSLLEQRATGKPLAYITGHREFWSLELKVTADTLIPRPDTETLVARALELIPTDRETLVADLGTGSGAIAAAIASERPRAKIIASDNSEEALKVATYNFNKLQLINIETAPGSWYDALPRGLNCHLILSNPPYVAEKDPHLSHNGLPWEPQTALTSGIDGLNDIRLIINQAPEHLTEGGYLLLEHGPDQGKRVRQLMTDRGFQSVTTHLDMEERERTTEGRISPSQPQLHT